MYDAQGLETEKVAGRLTIGLELSQQNCNSKIYRQLLDNILLLLLLYIFNICSTPCNQNITSHPYLQRLVLTCFQGKIRILGNFFQFTEETFYSSESLQFMDKTPKHNIHSEKLYFQTQLVLLEQQLY